MRRWGVIFGIMVTVSYAGDLRADGPPFEEILKIDVHSHIFEEMPEFVAMMRRVDLHIVNICVKGNQPEILKPLEQQAEVLHKKYPTSFHFASTFDLTQRNAPDYTEQVTAWLDKSFAAGAVMAKIWKEVGMELKTPAGEYLMPDDPVFDPIYKHLAVRDKPLLAHLAEPIEAWLPLDSEGLHYRYYSTHPEWHVYKKEGFPSRLQIMAARDRILDKHPTLTVIGAHCGSMSHNVDEIAERLDRYPNFYIEVSARTRDLANQRAGKVRDFFIKYQDRIMYGVDLGRYPNTDNPSSEKQRIEFTEKTESRYRSEYKYYSGKGTVDIRGREVECLNLPLEVLEKFYHKNAQRLIPELADR